MQKISNIDFWPLHLLRALMDMRTHTHNRARVGWKIEDLFDRFRNIGVGVTDGSAVKCVLCLCRGLECSLLG